MKEIQLPNRKLNIPESWKDLNMRQFIFALELLQKLSAGIITPDIARFELLFLITGYKPSKKFKSENYLPEEIEIIKLNLINLSKLMNFIFRKEGETLLPNDVFLDNPFPFITIGTKRYHGKIFERAYIPKTDISALEFSDAIDIYTSMTKNMRNKDFVEECVNTICAILYPYKNNHRENMRSKHVKRMKKIHPTIRYGIMLWFSGLIRFFTQHPVYGVLFGSHSEDTTKVNVGMYECILAVSEAGYGDITTIENQNLISFFDMQVKNLKNVVSKAIAQGIDKIKLANEMKLPLTTIEKLC